MVGSARQLNRHSMEASLAAYAQSNLPGQLASSDSSSGRPSLANIQSSYSTNDIPTVKNPNGAVPTVTPPKTHAEQHFHNHNASLGRIPPNALGNRHSRELSGPDNRRDDPMLALQGNGYQQNASSPQASAASYGSQNLPVSLTDTMANQIAQVNSPQYASPSFYGGYGMQLMNMGMTPLQMSNPAVFNQQLQTYQQQNSFAPFQNYGQPGRFQDSQARIIQQRRMQNNEENARFSNVRLEHVQGEIYGLCKDQHGCRYLQKQLESGNPEHVHLIFVETNAHVVELMTDPFGNYLCQKLLEYSNDDQRTVLINNAAPSMVKIALNQHGTRALQKMIEFISTRKQIQTIIFALHDRVVELIQDLNGNHVIQKCLNRLTPDDAQVCTLAAPYMTLANQSSLSSTLLVRIAWLLGPTVMAAASYSAASTMPLATRKRISSAKSLQMLSHSFRIHSATMCFNTLWTSASLPSPTLFAIAFRGAFRFCPNKSSVPT